MIQDIAPHVYDNAFAHRREARPDDAVLITKDEKAVLIRETEDGFRFPTVAEVGDMPLRFGFLIDGIAYFFGEEGVEMEGFSYVKQAEFRAKKPRYLAFAAVTGFQLVRWMHTQNFCGACGTKLEPSTWERAFVCPKCGRINYPRLNPAVIVAVLHEDKILVTTYSDRPSKGMACIAGFAEIGETIESPLLQEPALVIYRYAAVRLLLRTGRRRRDRSRRPDRTEGRPLVKARRDPGQDRRSQPHGRDAGNVPPRAGTEIKNTQHFAPDECPAEGLSGLPGSPQRA